MGMSLLDVGTEDFANTENTGFSAKSWPKNFIHMSVYCELRNMTAVVRMAYLAAGKCYQACM